MENIIFFCAHNDDQVIGAGGTIAKYSREGKNIITVIFSYGEKSHPWMEPSHIIKDRIKEAKESNEILKGGEMIFYDVKEANFKEDLYNVKDKVIALLKEKQPSKIFYHSENDPHPNHVEVNKFITSLLDHVKGDAYTFDVWTPIRLKNRNTPKMVVDISDTFKKKVRAFKVHKSQKLAIMSLLWSVYVKAFWNGLSFGYKYAEVFNKIK